MDKELDQILRYMQRGILHDNMIRMKMGVISDDIWNSLLKELTDRDFLITVNNPALTTQHLLNHKGIDFLKSGGYSKRGFFAWLKSDTGYGNLKWLLGLVIGFFLGWLSYSVTH